VASRTKHVLSNTPGVL